MNRLRALFSALDTARAQEEPIVKIPEPGVPQVIGKQVKDAFQPKKK